MNNKKSFGVDELSSLPSSWCCATLDELMKKIVDGTHHTPTYIEEGVPFLSVKDIRNGEIYFDNCKYISQEEHEELCKRCSPEYGDLLITKSGTIGRCAVVKTKRDFSLFVSVALLKPAIQEVNISYISLAFQSWFQNINVQNDVTGTAIKNFHLVDFRRLALPIAPLNEQKRIIGKIEALQKRSQRVKEAIDAIPQLLDQFRQSVLAAAFRGDLTADWRENNPDVEPASVLLEKICADKRKADAKTQKKSPLKPNISKPDYLEFPESWDIVISHDLFVFVTSGSRGWAKYYSDDGAIFLRVGNLNRNTISLDLTSIQRVNLPVGVEGTRTRVQPKDILISITADIGMVAVIPENIPEAYINQHIALARPQNNVFVDYVAWYITSSEGGFKQLKELQRGATKIGLGLGDIRSLWIPLPSLEEQQEIVHQIQSFFKAAETIEQQYQETKANLDQLNQSILAKAFRGELVSQNPNDEPASILLERIRAEREKLEQQTKAAKKSKGKTTKRRSKKAPQKTEEAIQLELPGMEQ